MIPALVYIILRIMKNRDLKSFYCKITSGLSYRKTYVAFTMIIFLILRPCLLSSQQQALTYKVIRHGLETGWVTLHKSTAGNKTIISMNSELNVRVLMLFKIVSTEYAEFLNGQMIHSYIFRKLNETVKANIHTRLGDKGYEIDDASGQKKLGIGPITFNVLSMYFAEPTGLQKVYCDSQQKMATVEKMGTDIYKLHLPDGNSNEYYYRDGICVKVKIDSSYYTVEFILSK